MVLVSLHALEMKLTNREKLRELPADPESSDEPELSDASDGSELSDGPNRRLHLEVMRPVHKESSTREHAYRFGSLMELEAHPSACMPEILLDFDHLCSDPSIYILDSNRIMISDVELRDFGRTEYEGDGVPTLYIIDWQKGTIQAVGHSRRTGDLGPIYRPLTEDRLMISSSLRMAPLTAAGGARS